MKNLKLAVLILALVGAPVMAQELVPATSEDIQEFDRQVSQHIKKDQERKSNFGAKVSEEAKKLKDDGADKRKEFGKWVSSQRKKNEQARPSAQGSIGQQNGSNGNGSRGNSATAPGKGPKKGR